MHNWQTSAKRCNAVGQEDLVRVQGAAERRESAKRRTLWRPVKSYDDVKVADALSNDRIWSVGMRTLSSVFATHTIHCHKTLPKRRYQRIHRITLAVLLKRTFTQTSCLRSRRNGTEWSCRRSYEVSKNQMPSNLKISQTLTSLKHSAPISVISGESTQDKKMGQRLMKIARTLAVSAGCNYCRVASEDAAGLNNLTI